MLLLNGIIYTYSDYNMGLAEAHIPEAIQYVICMHVLH